MASLIIYYGGEICANRAGFEHLRQLVAAGSYVVTQHAIERAQQRGIKLRELSYGASAGQFHYAGHRMDLSTGQTKFTVRWLERSTGLYRVALIALSPDLCWAAVVTLWR